MAGRALATTTRHRPQAASGLTPGAARVAAAGLSLNGSTGAISGTPTSPGMLTITATDSANPQNTGSRSVKIKEAFAAFSANSSQTFLETDYASAGFRGMRKFGLDSGGEYQCQPMMGAEYLPGDASCRGDCHKGTALLEWSEQEPRHDCQFSSHVCHPRYRWQPYGTASSNCWENPCGYDRSYSYVADVTP